MGAGLVELLEDVEAVEDDLLARFLDFAREEDLVQNCVDFVEIEDEVLWGMGSGLARVKGWGRWGGGVRHSGRGEREEA